MGQPGFWNDQEAAQATIAQLKGLKGTVEPFETLKKSCDDLVELAELMVDDPDEETEQEVNQEAEKLEQAVEKFELRVMLSDPADSSSAYLSVQAGAGGTESCDWAEMLLRMYTRWIERSGYSVKMVENVAGEEAGIRSAVLQVSGDMAYGYLKAEIGVHRLVRLSPFDSAHRRHTSFAAVDVMPEAEDIEIEINEDELRIDRYRAGGPGGQHVNTSDSAVRITHLPTGIVVQCQNERSQHKNRKTAMSMLKSRLYQQMQREREEALANAYNEKGEIAWGNQIRSYVLHPYNQVKDLRTEVKTSDTQGVLDGDIDMFIEAYLRHALRESQ